MFTSNLYNNNNMTVPLAKTLNQLKLSNKGKLHYDNRWHETGNVSKLLEDWTSGPRLSRSILSLKDSPSPSQVIQHLEKPRSNLQTGLLNFDKDDDEKILEKEIIKVSQLEVSIINYENKIKKKIKVNLESRINSMEEYCNQLHKRAVQQIESFRINQQREAELQLEKQKTIEALRNEELRQKQLELREHHMIKAKALDQKLEALRRQQLQEAEQRMCEMQSRLAIIINLSEEIKKICDSTAKHVDNCQGKQYLSNQIKKGLNMLENIQSTAQQIEVMARQKEALPDHIQLLRQLMEQTKTPLEVMIGEITKANEKYKIEKVAEKTTLAQKTVESISPTIITKIQNNKSSISDELLEFVSADALKEYINLQDKKEKIQKLCEEFKPDVMKKLRNELKMAVNTLINTISNVSGVHLRDRIHKINTLLRGSPVEIGNKRISWSGSKNGSLFCMDLIATAILKQAQEQISANKTSAFSLAAVALAIWCNFPDFGELLLAHFHTKCPYLVPYYIPQREGQSKEEYFTARGYNYKDGEIEGQGAFLKRMKGIVTVYAAIIQSEVPPGINGPHPFGPHKGWTWLTHCLNLNPSPDITATVIHEFLDIAGHVLFKNYGKQFQKVLHVLCRDFMSKLEKITEGQSGPVTRLQTFLQNCVARRGGILPPEGMLTSYFWNSRG